MSSVAGGDHESLPTARPTAPLLAVPKRKVAVITGITGQDGSYLAEFLLKKDYIVHGIIRRSSSFNTKRLNSIFDKLCLHHGDLTDSSSIHTVIALAHPDEVYNLAAQSHVKVSFEMPEYTNDVDGLGTLRMLEAIRTSALPIRFYQASTSELFGSMPPPQDELTPFHPRSPYAVAKLAGYWLTVNYREAYKMFCCNGILFNHESPRRGPTFVTRKVTRAVARMVFGQGALKQDCLSLGNLDAMRDWGHAKDYVEAMWMMLQHGSADDYVVATGEYHSVREFVEAAFACVGVTVEWQGAHGTVQEVGVDAATKKVLIRIDPRYFRPTEVDALRGNPAKVKRVLGWSPRVLFSELVREMVSSDCDAVKRGLDLDD